MDLLAAMRAVTSEALGGVAAERVRQEVVKACSAPAPGRFLRVLRDGDSLAPWLAEFRGADTIPAGPPEFHDADVLEHTARVMDRCAGDPLRVWMALCHDIGKTATARELLPRHFGHEEKGQDLSDALAQRLRLPSRYFRAGRLAARWHMAAGRYAELRLHQGAHAPGTGQGGIADRLFALAAADGEGTRRREPAWNSTPSRRCACLKSIATGGPGAPKFFCSCAARALNRLIYRPKASRPGHGSPLFRRLGATCPARQAAHALLEGAAQFVAPRRSGEHGEVLPEAHGLDAVFLGVEAEG
jgi:hypothetical protein